MTHTKHASGYIPDPDYTQEDRDEVCDSPELAAWDLAKARSYRNHAESVEAQVGRPVALAPRQTGAG